MNNTAAKPRSIEPQRMDILCGRTKQCAESEGNARYRYCIESFRSKYANAMTKHDKTGVTREIYETLKAIGSRFLKFNSSLQVWQELSARAARDKVGHALRFANRGKRRDAPPTSAQLVSIQPRQLQPTTMLGHASSPSPLCEARSQPSQPQHMIGNPAFAASHHLSLSGQHLLVPPYGPHHAIQQIMCHAHSAASSESGTTQGTSVTPHSDTAESASASHCANALLSTSDGADKRTSASHQESTSLSSSHETNHHASASSHVEAFVTEWMELTARDSKGAPPVSCDSFRLPERTNKSRSNSHSSTSEQADELLDLLDRVTSPPSQDHTSSDCQDASSRNA